jgi:hypothetical protein
VICWRRRWEMSYTTTSGVVMSAAATQAQAIKASGAIVSMEPDDFMSLLMRVEKPLVVRATGGVINKNYQYLVGYKGLVFYTKSSVELPLPLDTHTIAAKRVWIPA